MSAIPVLILFGPTASGKTAILEELFIPGNYPAGNNLHGQTPKNTCLKAEIISADSMQVYKGMDIGTAKPSRETQAKIPHHLIDIKSPAQQFNAGEFVRLAENAIRSADKNSALPVVSGGTGFYLRNLIMGLPAAPPPDPQIRNDLKAELTKNGTAALISELKEKDPVSAARIHPNDEYRLLRALEVIRQTSQPLSYFAQNGSAAGAAQRSPFRFLVLGLKREREDLYKRINERCSQMFRGGLAAEARQLFDAGFTPNDPGLKAIGYNEFFIRDPADPNKFTFTADLEGAQALIAQNSRRYAKRQMVFFKNIPDVIWIDGTDPHRASQEIRILLEGFLEEIYH
ncbi:MAG: tRNA (adenosine(37)-N6)-dimethylallyltransferase MiaA [Treponema sp.]|nr:tRNA (adenosine(37)-N6)-dimethylallyltransferase MiaA [Treponema sp.]